MAFSNSVMPATELDFDSNEDVDIMALLLNSASAFQSDSEIGIGFGNYAEDKKEEESEEQENENESEDQENESESEGQENERDDEDEGGDEAQFEWDFEKKTDIPAPCLDGLDFKTAPDWFNYLERFAHENGFGLKERRSNWRNGVLRQLYVACDLSRVDKFGHKEGASRSKTTRIRDCPFDVAITLRNGAYTATVRKGYHNHGPVAPTIISSRRHMDASKHMDKIKAMLRQGLKTRRILSVLRDHDPEMTLRARDIYNIKEKVHLEFLDARHPIQALVMALPKDDKWVFKWKTDGENRVTCLFATHRSSIDLLSRNPYILFMDCTYKTNKYGMPLLDIVGVTSSNSTFYAGFVFLRSERQDSYAFALSCIRLLYRDHLRMPITLLKTVLVDKDQALLNQISCSLPGTNSMICLWHINKNIKMHALPLLREKFDDVVDKEEYRVAVDNAWTEMKSRWLEVVNSQRVVEMNRAWSRFRQEYAEYDDFLSYIEDEWLERKTARRFLHCYTRRYLHFGHSTTSRNEGSHWNLKQELQV